MDAMEKLRQSKGGYDKYIDALLADPNCSEKEWGLNVILGRRAASAWAETLREMAPQMDYTLQLDKQADEVLTRYNHFMHFIVEYRMRHLGEDDDEGAGVPAPAHTPPLSGAAAKPLPNL